MRTLVLGSTSRYRRELLSRLGLQFTTVAPQVDEVPVPGEQPLAMARRLALAKAADVGRRFEDALVIGSDQVAVHGGKVLGKPGNAETAVAQLTAMSGATVTFLTGLCLLDTRDRHQQADVIAYQVRFRQLDDIEIRNYVARERPLDCAGAFKSEGLGVALFDAMQGDDPTALIGLPLIRLCAMLRAVGLDPLRS